jgi:hypothetical protein
MADASSLPHGFIHGGITPNPETDTLEKNQLYSQSRASGTLASN